jgi:predicted SnoaL-like aldol condensation-catalyzing enzyme
MGDETSRDKRTALALLTEGNFVVLHTRQEWPGDANWAGMDIFRFEGGRIVERWDVLQRVPAEGANASTIGRARLLRSGGGGQTW